MSAWVPLIVTLAVPTPATAAPPAAVAPSTPFSTPSWTVLRLPFGSLTESPLTASTASSVTTLAPGTTFTGLLIADVMVTTIVLGTGSSAGPKVSRTLKSKLVGPRRSPG